MSVNISEVTKSLWLMIRVEPMAMTQRPSLHSEGITVRRSVGIHGNFHYICIVVVVFSFLVTWVLWSDCWSSSFKVAVMTQWRSTVIAAGGGQRYNTTPVVLFKTGSLLFIGCIPAKNMSKILNIDVSLKKSTRIVKSTETASEMYNWMFMTTVYYQSTQTHIKFHSYP